MTAIAITRDDAKEVARERLAEILADVVPGFRPERPFRCLSPNHEDRHPSMHYLSRTKTVKCFSCGWSGDVFSVVGAVYGLSGGGMFAKTYSLLGIEARGGGYTRTKKPAAPKHAPGSIEYLRALIYPPGWNVIEVPPLPMPLRVIADAEAGLLGWLVLSPDDFAVCEKCGLAGWHFDDAELGEFYSAMLNGAALLDYNPAFREWLTERASAGHMTRKLVRFIIAEGQRRKLEGVFARAYTRIQNDEATDAVMGDVLRLASDVTGYSYALPTSDVIQKKTRDAFERYHKSESPAAILSEWKGQ